MTLENGKPNPTVDEKYLAVHEGLAIIDWYHLIIDYAKVATEEGKNQDVFVSLKALFDASVFSSDDRVLLELQLYVMSICFHSKMFDRTNQVMRMFLQEGPFYVGGMRMFTQIFTNSDPAAIQAFACSANQKFFQRQISKWIKNEEEGSNTLSQEASAHLFATYAHILFCAKSYSMAIQYYMKAKLLHPTDPNINLCLGVTFFHRASQKTESRHTHVLRVHLFTELVGFRFPAGIPKIKRKSR